MSLLSAERLRQVDWTAVALEAAPLAASVLVVPFVIVLAFPGVSAFDSFLNAWPDAAYGLFIALGCATGSGWLKSGRRREGLVIGGSRLFALLVLWIRLGVAIAASLSCGEAECEVDGSTSWPRAAAGIALLAAFVLPAVVSVPLLLRSSGSGAGESLR